MIKGLWGKGAADKEAEERVMELVGQSKTIKGLWGKVRGDKGTVEGVTGGKGISVKEFCLT